MIKFIQDSWLVIVSSLVFGLLVAGVHGALKERIAENGVKKRSENMTRLLGDCEFKPIKENEEDEEPLYFEAREGDKVVGYCFITEGAGFADRIELLVAVDSKFEKCKGFAVMYSQETPGFGDKIMLYGDEKHFSTQFIDSPCPKIGNLLKVEKVGKKLDNTDNVIVALTGATITSEAVTTIVNDSILLMRDKITH